MHITMPNITNGVYNLGYPDNYQWDPEQWDPAQWDIATAEQWNNSPINISNYGFNAMKCNNEEGSSKVACEGLEALVIVLLSLGGIGILIFVVALLLKLYIWMAKCERCVLICFKCWHGPRDDYGHYILSDRDLICCCCTSQQWNRNMNYKEIRYNRLKTLLNAAGFGEQLLHYNSQKRWKEPAVDEKNIIEEYIYILSRVS